MYYHRKNSVDGYHNSCKKCISIDCKSNYLKNKEKIKERVSKYCHNNKEIINQKKKVYRQTHKEHISKILKEYYQKNKYKLIGYAKENYQNNKEKIKRRIYEYQGLHPEKIAKYRHKRRVLHHSLPVNFTEQDWNDVKKVFYNKCAYCGKEKRLTQDHFVSVKNGGEYTKNNIVPACVNCNSSKQSTSFFEWYPSYKCYNKQREEKILNYLGYKNGMQQLKII